MPIQIGDTIPNIAFQMLTSAGMQTISTDKILKGSKVILFGSPGAFLPDCTDTHLPGYMDQADQLKRTGIDQLICMAVNDPYVMHRWSQILRISDQLLMLPDGNGDLTRALGMEINGTTLGLGMRCNRFSMIVEDAKVKTLDIEKIPTDVDVTSALCMLGRLK